MLLSLKCHPIIISSWPNSIGIISLGSTMFHCLSSCFTRPHLTALQFNDAFFARPASHRLPKFKTPALRELMHHDAPKETIGHTIHRILWQEPWIRGNSLTCPIQSVCLRACSSWTHFLCPSLRTLEDWVHPKAFSDGHVGSPFQRKHINTLTIGHRSWVMDGFYST